MNEILNTTVKYTKSLKSFAYTDMASEGAYEIIISDMNRNGNHQFNCIVTTPEHTFINVLGWEITEIIICQDWYRYFAPTLKLVNSEGEQIEVRVPERISPTRNVDGFKFQRRFSEIQTFIDEIKANHSTFEEYLESEAK